MGFSEVSGFRLEHETVTYSHGLSYREGEQLYKYYFDKYVPITLKKGTISGINFLYDWLQDKQNSQRIMQVSLCDEQGHPVVSWHAGKVIPVKLEAAGFDVNSNDVSIESLEVMAANISLQRH